MSTRNNNNCGDRARWGLGVLGSLTWKPFGVAENSGPQAAMPKRRVARGALNSHGLIGQPKQRRGSRGQRRRQCDEHISRAGGGGWVAVSREKSYSSSSNNQGVADAPRVHAANAGAGYHHTPPTYTSPVRAPQAGRDLSPSQISDHQHHQQRQYHHQYVTQESAWTYDDRGMQNTQTRRVRSPSHVPDQRPPQAAHHVRHTPQHQHYLEDQHQQQRQQRQQQQQQYVRQQPQVQRVSADNRRYHVYQEVQHHQGQCYGQCHSGCSCRRRL